MQRATFPSYNTGHIKYIKYIIVLHEAKGNDASNSLKILKGMSIEHNMGMMVLNECFTNKEP